MGAIMRRNLSFLRLINLLCSIALVSSAGFTPAYAVTSIQNTNLPVYRQPMAPTEARVEDVLSRLTLQEKLDFLGGTGFESKPIARLGIPTIKMADGPVGVRWGQATAFPAGVNIAATFDPELTYLAAQAMGIETKGMGRNMLLGPCIGIARHPFGGRNFESYGEDPYLTSRLAQSYVWGLQGEGVLASAKHYAVNDQEHKRTFINTLVEERALREIHLPMFQAAIDAGAWSVMASYNKINGFWATENYDLLTRILKLDWGFQGFVVSDWHATHSTLGAAQGGLDLEMPYGNFLNAEKLMPFIQSGQVTEKMIDDKVRRVLRAIFASGIFDAGGAPNPDPKLVGSERNLAISRRVAAEGAVLLKNDQSVLPLDISKSEKIAVIGPGARYLRTGGGGSSKVIPTREVSPFDAMKSSFKNSKLAYSMGYRLEGDFEAIDERYLRPTKEKNGVRGLQGEYYANKFLQGEPVMNRVDSMVSFDWGWSSPGADIPVDGFSVRWTGYLETDRTGRYIFAVRGDDGVRLWINDELVINQWSDHPAFVYNYEMNLEANQEYKIKLEYYENGGHAIVGLGFAEEDLTMQNKAVELAAKADTAVVFVGLSANFESEEVDRKIYDLPQAQNQLISRIASVNPRTIIVINAGNPVGMPWINEVQSVIYAWYPGQEGGFAIADLISGAVNPSGKLPVSFPVKWEDSPAFGAFPEDSWGQDQLTYKEGIFVGYRHFDTKGIVPLFPFGHGLSYTDFQYSDLNVLTVNSSSKKPEVVLSFNVTNVGSRAGSEVPQVYVRDTNPIVEKAFQELKGFQKVSLQPGETKNVKIKLNSGSFAYWSTLSHGWHVNSGLYEVRVGSSSRDIRLTSPVYLK